MQGKLGPDLSQSIHGLISFLYPEFQRKEEGGGQREV